MIGIFRHHPLASGDSCAGLLTALGRQHDIRFFTARQCTDNALASCDLIAFPGGVGEADDWHKVLRPVRPAVQRYVAEGGKFLGICMGAYWAGPEYFNLLSGVKPEQYIKRPGAEIRRSYRTVAEVNWQGTQELIYFWDGPAFIAPVRNYKTLALYRNGDPAAIMQGNVGLIGPHLEAMRTWFRSKKLAPLYHDGAHFELLREFVDELLAR